MRFRSIFVWLFLVGLIGANGLVVGQDEDEYGKLVGCVMDPYTGLPVFEVFDIEFYKCDTFELMGSFLKEAKTDNMGRFSIKLRPYKYCLHFSPESKESKYCIEPSHFKNDQYCFPVVIEKGKVTRFIKKAIRGGSLKINLKDINGIRITKDLFPAVTGISILLKNRNFLIPPSSRTLTDDNLDDGEMIINRLFPDKFKIEI